MANNLSAFLIFFCFVFCKSVRARSSPDVPVLDRAVSSSMSSKQSMTSSDGKLMMVFSDLDGTLIHYPEDRSDRPIDEEGNRILELPPSATGMRGLISSKTLALCRDLRRKGIKLVLVSGMRTSTLIKRLPYLPKADAYCTEAGGRIFYPTKNTDECGFLCTPVEYDGSEPSDLQPFGLREDMNWRKLMVHDDAAGWEGYSGNEITKKQDDPIPIDDRTGALWKFASQLQKEGFTIDSKSYSTCFRINRKYQSGVAQEKFDSLLNGDIVCPPNLARSTNLGCVDFYPVISGKKNCCKYLAKELGGSGVADLSRSVCICDDDNDIEMALACSHAFIPALSSRSMEHTIKRNIGRFTTTFAEGVEETSATEAALLLIYNRVVQERP